MDLDDVTSPLLELPAELRTEIWTNLVGGRILHLKSDRTLRRPPINAHISPDKLGLVQRALYRIRQGCDCAICMAETPEATTPDYEPRRYLSYIEAFEVRVISGVLYTPCPIPDLNILRANRQIYQEAFHVLWTTNVFSFNLPSALETFIRSLKPNQGNKLAKLHIATVIDPRIESAWNSLLDNHLVQSLPALNTLNVCLKLGSSRVEHYNHMSDLPSNNTVQSFLGLQNFPLSSVNIILDRKVSWNWLRSLFEKPNSPYRGLLEPPVEQEHVYDSESWRRKLECLLEACFLKHPKADEVAEEFVRRIGAE
ncbi:MAG: hypothetical protein Q9209_004872 [Squamulea sp. 1 TL-2023]